MSNMLQDRIARAQGAAARAVGTPTHAFRPRGPANPLAAENRYLRLPALLLAGTRPNAALGTAPSFGAALYQAVLDSAYTRQGDYLAQEDDVYFIAAQPPFGPVLCVRTNRTISLRRPAPLTAIGANPYQGMERAAQLEILTAWPASVLGTAQGAAPDGGLPGRASAPRRTVLLPPGLPAEPRHGDILADSQGNILIAHAVEETALGWRLSATQAVP